jgi:hypothetical protein
VTERQPEPQPADDASAAPGDGRAAYGAFEVTREEVLVRRSPRIWRILGLGVVVGAVVALVTTIASPEVEGFSKGQIFGFSLLIFGVLFGALAALVAILLERIVGRRTVTMEAERVRAIAPDDEPGITEQRNAEPGASDPGASDPGASDAGASGTAADGD